MNLAGMLGLFAVTSSTFQSLLNVPITICTATFGSHILNIPITAHHQRHKSKPKSFKSPFATHSELQAGAGTAGEQVTDHHISK
jgi:hypothetical protein